MNYFELLYKKYDKLMLTKKEVAHELGISETTLNRKLRFGELNLAYDNSGQKYTFTLKSIAEHLEGIDSLAA